MYLKTYHIEKNFMVAVCDRELIGRKLTRGSTTVEIAEAYYKGEIADEEKVVAMLLQATTANIFGDRAVACAIKAGIIGAVIMIDTVPHALYFTI